MGPISVVPFLARVACRRVAWEAGPSPRPRAGPFSIHRGVVFREVLRKSGRCDGANSSDQWATQVVAKRKHSRHGPDFVPDGYSVCRMGPRTPAARDTGQPGDTPMRWPQSWDETAKASAYAVLARRAAPIGRSSVATPWSFDAHDVWLSRVRPPRERGARLSVSRSTTTHR